MNLGDNDEVIGMQMSSQGKDMLIVSEKGMGKRTNMDEFTRQNRGGKGVKCYKITEKTGNVVGMKAVDEDNEITIDFHIIVSYGVNIATIADNIISNVKYKVEEFTGMSVKKVNVYVEGVRNID